MNLGPVAERWAKTRLAHEAVMLDDAQQMLRIDRERLKAFVKNTTGHVVPEGEDVVHIGDQKSAHGIGALGVAGIALASSILPAALAGYLLLREPSAGPASPTLDPQKFRVDWRVQDGKADSKVTPLEK